MVFSRPWIMLRFLARFHSLSVHNISFHVFLGAIDPLVIYGSLSVHLGAHAPSVETHVHPYVLLQSECS